MEPPREQRVRVVRYQLAVDAGRPVEQRIATSAGKRRRDVDLLLQEADVCLP